MELLLLFIFLDLNNQASGFVIYMQEGIIKPLFWEIKVVCKPIRSGHSECERSWEDREPIQQEEESINCIKMVEEIVVL